LTLENKNVQKIKETLKNAFFK